MGKKRGFLRKMLFMFFILAVISVVFFLQHFGIIAFSGNGELGWGSSASMNTNFTIKELPEVLTFYFNKNDIYYDKKKVSLDDFKKIIAQAEKEEKRLNLLFVEENTTNEFYQELKNFLSKKKVYISENYINQEDMKKAME